MTNRTLLIRGVALACLASHGGTVQAQDSAVTVRGVLQVLDSAAAILALQAPLAVPNMRTNALTLVGDPRRWNRDDSRYVEVVGTLAPPQVAVAGRPALPALRVTKVREVDPDGLVRRTISTSFTQRVIVTLAVVPGRLMWRDPAGQATGVAPVVLFTVINHGEVPLGFEFPSNEFVCVSVTPPDGGEPAWNFAWKAHELNTKLIIKIGSTFKSVIPLPEAAAGEPGRHTVRAMLCGIEEYALDVPLDVYRD
jgi:hypothetical protein